MLVLASAAENILTIPVTPGSWKNDNPAPTLNVVIPVALVKLLASITSLVDLLIVIVAIPTSIPPPRSNFIWFTVTPLPLKFNLVIEPAKPVGVISSFCTSIPSTLPDGAPEGAAQYLSPSVVP